MNISNATIILILLGMALLIAFVYRVCDNSYDEDNPVQQLQAGALSLLSILSFLLSLIAQIIYLLE